MIEETSYGIILKLKGSKPARFLVVRQKDHWSFPKGHKEGNETVEQTVRRELEEETGIRDVEIVSDAVLTEAPYMFERSGEYIQKTNQYICGEISIEHVEIQEGEIFDSRFATFDELRSLMTRSSQQAFLEIVQNVYEHTKETENVVH